MDGLRTAILNHLTLAEYVELRQRLADDISKMILRNKPVEWDLEDSYKIIKDGKIQTRGASGDYETQQIIMYESDVQANIEDKDIFDEILYHYMDQNPTDNMGSSNPDFGKIAYDPAEMHIYFNAASYYSEPPLGNGELYFGHTGTAGEDGSIDPGIAFNSCTEATLEYMEGNGTGGEYDDSICVMNNVNYTIYINNTNGENYFVFEDPDNVSQFLEITREIQHIDPEKAKAILDTSIVELIPSLATRQQYINRFFNDYAILKGNIPGWIYDNLSNASAPDTYSTEHDISNTSGDESNKFITRLQVSEDGDNINQSLQWLRDDINQYLEDLNYNAPDLLDQRPEYENKQGGYLQVRNMNQAVIVRKVEDSTSDLLTPTSISGTDIQTEWLGVTEAPSYLANGFTISMWVKFKDKVSTGTLFNFGNPLRDVNPFGIRLETYVINDENNQLPSAAGAASYGDVAGSNNPNGELFIDDKYERFIRLVVRELPSADFGRGKIRSSFVGSTHFDKDTYNGFPTAGFDGNPDHGFAPNNSDDDQWVNSLGLFNGVKVPQDLNEWYFIVATYDSTIDEDYSDLIGNNSLYWMGHTSDGYDLMHRSGYGNRCKVEIISRSDLLRARGFKT